SSSEKSQKLLGWSPTKDFESGLIKTIDWYKSNEQWWRKLLWMRSIPIVMKDGKREMY
ncbi:MAG: epimerase, partial [Nitrospinae bacterium]|nr:epimerase [Nitrospinota bacterium]